MYFYDLIMGIIGYDEAMESSCHYKLLVEVLTILHMILYQSTKVICNDVFDTRYLFNVEIILQRTTIVFALSSYGLFLSETFYHAIGRID